MQGTKPNSTSCHSTHRYYKTRCRRQNLIPSLLSILRIRDVSHIHDKRCNISASEMYHIYMIKDAILFTLFTQRSSVNQTEMQSVGTGKNMHLTSTSINNADQQQFNHYMIGKVTKDQTKGKNREAIEIRKRSMSRNHGAAQFLNSKNSSSSYYKNQFIITP